MVITRIGIPKGLEWMECGAEFKKKQTGVIRLCRTGEVGFARMKFQIDYRDI